MSENQTAQKKPMPLALLLLAAHVVVNYRRLIGLFTGLSSLAAGGPIGIVQYLVNAVTALAPAAMLVLVAMYACQGKAVARTVSTLCMLMGAAFLINLGLALYRYFLMYQMDFYALFPQFGSLLASLAYGVGMLQIGSKLRKDKLRAQLRSYGLTFYLLMFAVAAFIIMPSFVDVSVDLPIGSITSYILLIVGAGCLPGTLLEGGEKARNVDVTSGVVAVAVAACLFILPSTFSYTSSYQRSSLPEVTTVTCPSCHKEYTDSSNKRSIERSNMCTNCKIGFEATKDALGW